MKITRSLSDRLVDIKELLGRYPEISAALDLIKKNAGVPYLVGGAVRDLILNKPIQDIDIEVHNLSLDQLSNVLKALGPVSYVGKSFGVLRVDRSSIDWSLPRTDTSGRKPQVNLDPHMGINEALKRRDLTMNALAINLITYELIDPFDGIDDMKKKILRSPDLSFFCEDPLRFYRVMSFIGRFEFYPDAPLENLCRGMDISDVSVERIDRECEKLLLKSSRPSLGIRWLAQLGRLGDVLPELVKTQTTEQDYLWHPEGNVFEHLMQSLDAAVLTDCGSEERNLVLRYAALCHDLGKVDTTLIKNGRVKSPGHAEAGVSYARTLLKRLTRNQTLIRTVEKLVKYHMAPGQFIALGAKNSAYKRLALKLAPEANLELLAYLALSDRRGRNPHGPEPLADQPPFYQQFLENADKAQALTEPEKPVLQGKDIQDLVEPGPRMGRLLSYAYDLQLEFSIKDKTELRKKVHEKIAEET